MNSMPNPKPKSGDVKKVYPTKRDTFIDVIFNQKKALKV
jgi:hypothetical protein